MKITFDKEADAVYIEFSSGEFVSNKKIDNDTIIDLDKDDDKQLKHHCTAPLATLAKSDK